MNNDIYKKYDKEGYVVFNINDDVLIDCVNKDIDEILKSNEFRTNTKIYSYNESPRIIESFKKSKNCKKLSIHQKVFNFLKGFYKEDPRAFSTINFLKSTQQPLHSDYAHFGTIPELKLAGSWIALQNIDPKSGPVQVVPRSHKLIPYDFSDYFVEGYPPSSLSEIKIAYKNYEQWVESEIKKHNLKPITPLLKKGDCLVWDANMLHGSPECVDNSLLRKSQVTHWTFGYKVKQFNPIFSNIKKNKIVERKVEYIY